MAKRFYILGILFFSMGLSATPPKNSPETAKNKPTLDYAPKPSSAKQMKKRIIQCGIALSLVAGGYFGGRPLYQKVGGTELIKDEISRFDNDANEMHRLSVALYSGVPFREWRAQRRAHSTYTRLLNSKNMGVVDRAFDGLQGEDNFFYSTEKMSQKELNDLANAVIRLETDNRIRYTDNRFRYGNYFESRLPIFEGSPLPAFFEARLSSADLSTRTNAMAALGRLQSRQPIPKLRAILKGANSSFEDILMSGQALVDLDAKEAIPEFIALLDSENDNLRIMAVRALVALDAGPGVAAKLRDFLMSGDSYDGFDNHNFAEVFSYYAKITDDQNFVLSLAERVMAHPGSLPSSIRVMSIKPKIVSAVGQMNSPAALAFLRKFAQPNLDSVNRGYPDAIASAAISELGRLHDLESIPLFEKLIQESNSLQNEAAVALIQLNGSKAARQLLEAKLSSSDKREGADAFRALVQIGDPRDVPFFEKALNDSDFRWLAVNALHQLKSISSLPKLKAAWETETNPIRRSSIGYTIRYLEKLEKKDQ